VRKSLPRCSLGCWEREFRAKGKTFHHSSAKPNRWLTSLSGWLEDLSAGSWFFTIQVIVSRLNSTSGARSGVENV
jgi:hypothetical protein